MGLPGTSEKALINSLCAKIDEFNAKMNIPKTLKEFGINEDEFKEKLDILKDSHAGAFAIIVGISYFVLCFGVFSEVTADKLPVIGLGFMMSRAFSGLGLVTLKKAKNTGLLRTFADAAANKRVMIVMAIYIAVTAIAMVLLNPLYGCVAFGLALLTFWWYRSMAYNKFGGITGDLAGCFSQVCELVIALGVILL